MNDYFSIATVTMVAVALGLLVSIHVHDLRRKVTATRRSRQLSDLYEFGEACACLRNAERAKWELEQKLVPLRPHQIEYDDTRRELDKVGLIIKEQLRLRAMFHEAVMGRSR